MRLNKKALTEFELIQEIAFFRTVPLEANTALCERLNNFTNKVFSDPKLCDTSLWTSFLGKGQ